MFVTATADDVEDKLGVAAGTNSIGVTFTGGNISQSLAFQGQSGGSTACTPTFGNFTSSNQPANCWTPYSATSPFNSVVPGTASSACGSGASGSHPCFAGSSSTFVSTITAQGGSNFANGNWGASTPYPNANEFGHDVFWTGQSGTTDKWYKLTNVGGSFCNGNLAILRIPSVARPTGGSDSHMDIVDQSTGVETACDAFPKSLIPLPVGGTQGSPTTLNVGGAFCGQGNVQTSIGANPGTTGWCAPTSSFGDLAGMIRYEELSAGAINHALFVVVKGGGAAQAQVYPGQTGGVGATGTSEPPIGSLLWLDQPCSTINAITDIPAWDKAVLCALNKYGGYVGDTGGPNGISIGFSSDNAYTAYGLTGQMANFWSTHGITENNTTHTFFIPITQGATVTQTWWNTHLHVLDPCVAKQMAGATGGCSP